MQFYNTLTRKKEEFVPIEPGKVKMYACGPTVYNYFHVGNARCFVVFDMLRRYLEYRGYDVTFVQNFTDIDDKVIRRANEEGSDLSTSSPSATSTSISSMPRGSASARRTCTRWQPTTSTTIISIVTTLIDKGYAYAVDNGDVYFRTTKFKDYGKLSHMPIEDLEAGARIDVSRAERRSAGLCALEGAQSRASRTGTARGARAARAGTLSARR